MEFIMDGWSEEIFLDIPLHLLITNFLVREKNKA